LNYYRSNYGISLSEKEAKKIMDNFFKSYQGLNKWHKQTKARIYRQGVHETRTLSGRIRHFDKSTPQQVLNTPVQGTGADMLKLALGKLVSALKGLDCKILATVHDEIILEAKEEIADKVAKILSDTMVEAGKEFLLKVPVEAEASIGDNWADK
jgi:DNA polymerase I-like protein with 3'-5' exonuclease and polymerase domains